MIEVKNNITTKTPKISALDIAQSLVVDVSKSVRIVCETMEHLAGKLGAEIVCKDGKIVLQKSINNRIWDIMTFDPKKKELECVVDVYRKFRGSVSTTTGVEPEKLNLPLDITVTKVHEVRGPMDYLLNTLGRIITRKNGSQITVEMKLYEARLPNGDIVRYNCWDFRPYAIYRCQLATDTIACESEDHKRECIRLFAKDYCEGKMVLEEVATELDEILHRVNAGEISPSYLPGYEIHHNGYGEMLVLPNDIHCRKLAHIGGSWLMNESNYITLRQTKVESMCADVLNTHLKTNLKEWANISLELRQAKIVELGETLIQKLGLPASIQFGQLDDFTAGQYDENSRTIILNARLLEFQSPREIVHTLLHEMYHAIQYEAIANPAKYDISQFELELWSENLANYIAPELDFQGYIKQPVEYAAEKFAHDLTDKCFTDYV